MWKVGSTAGSKIFFILLAVLLFAFFLLDLFLGSVSIPIKDIIKTLVTGSSPHPGWNIILFDFRLPKAIAAVLAGVALGVSGLQMQTIFRNPLAGPDVLGVNSGASLGVAILVIGNSVFYTTHFSSIVGNWGIVAAACFGAAATLILILFISSRVRDVMIILILGIMIGAAISSFVSILQFFGNESLLKSFVVWTMGSLGHISKLQLLILLPCVMLGLMLSVFSIKKLDALMLSEKYAQSMGMNVKSARLLVFSSTSILAGSIVAFCGPIAFIGIAVPHLSRILFKTSQHKILLFGTMLIGAISLLICDIISQLPGSNLTLPINSVTALVGIPVVIWIIVKNKKENTW
jgi:iron complex transport system permease protein